MHSFTVLWVMALAMLAVSAAGLNTRRRRDSDDSDSELAPARNLPLERTGRYPRVTCDLLPGLITIGGPNTACAAHCLLQGKKGGHCDGAGVCVCRD